MDPFCYEPQYITSAMLEAESTLDLTLLNQNVNILETIVQLIMFGELRSFYIGRPC